MEAEKTYIPVTCWKCKTQNNLAESKMCRACNCYLRPDAVAGRREAFSSRSLGYGSFKGFVWAAVSVVMVIGGIVYFQKMSTLTSIAAPGEEKRVHVELPPESWYAKSWWSYISKTPSVKQIVKKSEEATGKMMAPEIARTLSISGTISQAVGDCFTQACANERQKQQDMELARDDFEFDQLTDGRVHRAPGRRREIVTPKVSDAWKGYIYHELGSVEVATKLPGKFMKRALVDARNGSYKKIEILEVFNGAAGSKTTRFLDETGRSAKTESKVMDAGAAALAKMEMESLWRKTFLENTDQQVRGIERVNDTVVFTITSKNKEGYPEVFYFDSVTGLPLKMDTKDFSVYFDNYRPYGKAIMPYAIYYRRAESQGFHSWVQFNISEWKIGDYIDDSVFENSGV